MPFRKILSTRWMPYRRRRERAILSLVLPAGKELSTLSRSTSDLVSGRSLEQGMGIPAYDSSCNTWTADLMFNEYLIQHFRCFTEDGSGSGLKYQLEYILQGTGSDMENLKGTAARLLLIREASNLLYLYQDESKRSQAQITALIIAVLFGIPQGAKSAGADSAGQLGFRRKCSGSERVCWMEDAYRC